MFVHELKNKPVSDTFCYYRLHRTDITECFHQIEINIADLSCFSSNRYQFVLLIRLLFQFYCENWISVKSVDLASLPVSLGTDIKKTNKEADHQTYPAYYEKIITDDIAMHSYSTTTTT